MSKLAPRKIGKLPNKNFQSKRMNTRIIENTFESVIGVLKMDNANQKLEPSHLSAQYFFQGEAERCFRTMI